MLRGEQSPDISKVNRERDVKLLQQISCTPKGKRIGLDELHLLGLHRDSSPNACDSSQDTFEVGWGDSPEPLNMEQRFKLYSTTMACKKRLEVRESPKSRRRTVRPSVRLAAKQPVDVSKYIAEVQALSKRITAELESRGNSPSEKENNFKPENSPNGDILELLNGDDLTNEYLIACSQSLENKLAKTKEVERKSYGGKEPKKQSELVAPTDSSFEKVLQSFITEEDDWLSQAVLNAEAKMTPRKNVFAKAKSENQLSSPERHCSAPSQKRLTGSALRRTYSERTGERARCATSGAKNDEPQRKGFR